MSDLQRNTPYLYFSLLETLVLWHPIESDALRLAVHLEALAWRSNQQDGLYYDKLVEKVLHFVFAKVEGANTEQVRLLSECAQYRMKLQLAVHLCLGRAGMEEEVQYVNTTLKKHYKVRLDAL